MTQPDPTAPLDDALALLLAEGRAAGAFPMAGAAVAQHGQIRGQAWAGGAGTDTLWDVASLTKPRAVVTLCMKAVSAGRWSLDDGVDAANGVTFRQLLSHRSGLAAWRDLGADVVRALGPAQRGWTPGDSEVRAVVDAALRDELEAADRRRGGALRGQCPAVYSDLGYILLGRELAARLGSPLDVLITGYGPTSAADVAPTGWCPLRKRELRGEVNDSNAWVLGGAAGHAGLFARLDDITSWAIGLARRSQAQAGDAGPPALIRRWWSGEGLISPGSWAIGWDRPTPGRSSAGPDVALDAVGHLGFTGTSVWIEPTAQRVFVLLTNRVALGPAAQPLLRAFRPRFHTHARRLLRQLG